MTKVSADEVAALLAVYLVQRSPMLPAARQRALAHLLEVALYERDAPSTYEELAEKAAELVALQTSWPEDVTRPALERCVKVGRVDLSDGKYTLAAGARQSIEDARVAYSQDEQHFDSALALAVQDYTGQELNELALPFLTSEVKRALAETLSRASIEVLHNQNGNPLQALLEIDERYEPLAHLQHSAKTIADSFSLPAEDLFVALRRFLGNLDSESKRFLAALHNKVFYRQVLNADPALHSVQRQALERTRLYLDTNIAIDVILDEVDDHGATADVVEASRRLGVKLFVSPITVDELRRQIGAAAKYVSLLEDSRIDALLTKYRHTAPPFFTAFLRRRNKNRTLTWVGFVAPYLDVEQYLLGKDILPEALGCGSIAEEPEYDRVWTALRQIRDERFSDAVISHDAQNFVLVHKLRTNNNENILFGHSVWLLTRDSNLARLERRMATEFKSPHSLQSEVWGRLLLPYQSIFDFTFSDYPAQLVQSRLGIAPEGDSLDVDFLNSLRMAEFDLDEILRLPEEHAASVLCSLQQDKFAQRLTTTLRESSDPQEVSEAGRKLSERALEIAVEEKDQALGRAKGMHIRLRTLENAVITKDAKLSELRERVVAQDKEISRLKGRSLLDRLRTLFGTD